MLKHDLEKLLGGFVTDTLTEEERQLLYRAALEDQALFNTLADEQALKELLTDPSVRARILEHMNRLSRAGAGSRLSRTDWFRRPMNLALAGGLTSALIAVILGTKIYRDSLTHRSPTSATEEVGRPALTAPPAPAPIPPVAQQADAQETGSDLPAPKRRDDRPAATQKKPTMAEPRTRPQTERTRVPNSTESKHTRSRPPEEPGRTVRPGQAVSSFLSDTEAPSTAQDLSPAALPSAPHMPATPSTGVAGSQGPTARALFYATAPATTDLQTAEDAAHTDEGTMKRGENNRTATTPMAEKKRAERSLSLLSQSAAGRHPPLALRYSLLMTGPGGLDLEVDAATAVGKDDAPRLIIQTNQDGYVSVYKTGAVGETTTRLFVLENDGRMMGRTALVVPLSTLFEEGPETEPVRLRIVFSRSPRNPQERPPAPSPMLLTERVEPIRPAAPAEHAVYVAMPDPGQTSLAIEVPLFLRP